MVDISDGDDPQISRVVPPLPTAPTSVGGAPARCERCGDGSAVMSTISFVATLEEGSSCFSGPSLNAVEQYKRRIGGLKIDDELYFHDPLDRQVGRFCAFA
jgi:hypothetical protein